MTSKNRGHRARPDDLPEPGDRCKDCGNDVVWLGPSAYDWAHIEDQTPQHVPQVSPGAIAEGEPITCTRCGATVLPGWAHSRGWVHTEAHRG